eukprot:CAMPEP_0174731806 /NCGR_PEP_ID=MMETSP1094-20130205/58211_1 /TAXON_ID=156173 /ORGANISM="Chrysochromulina brevifilum, Strain UTEX LB 985" /LENGTH=48 /DNA_ID= /DNA_START= /DNA_END= /DNA_ORIENTATION=
MSRTPTPPPACELASRGDSLAAVAPSLRVSPPEARIRALCRSISRRAR